MSLLKSLFPLSFSFKKDIPNMIIGILAYIVVGVVGGFVIGLTAAIPIVGLLCGILGALLEVYVVAGIVILVLAFLRILK